jgi:hypothetical protein
MRQRVKRLRHGAAIAQLCPKAGAEGPAFRHNSASGRAKEKEHEGH